MTANDKPKAAELARQLLEALKAEESNPDAPPFDEDALRERLRPHLERARKARSR